jgi:hypothetical protein
VLRLNRKENSRLGRRKNATSNTVSRISDEDVRWAFSKARWLIKRRPEKITTQFGVSQKIEENKKEDKYLTTELY